MYLLYITPGGGRAGAGGRGFTTPHHDWEGFFIPSLEEEPIKNAARYTKNVVAT